MDIFVPIRFRTTIQLSPADLVADFEQVLLHKVRASLEGVCSRFGYIRPGSISIIRRSTGSFVKQHFNGHIKFDMVCKAEVCNPCIGSVFEAVVKNKNALGIHAESNLKDDGRDETVMDIIIPKRSVGIVSTVNLDNVQVGDKIFVEVLGKRYQLNDTKISIIGRAIQEPQRQERASLATNADADELQEIPDIDDEQDQYVEGDNDEDEDGNQSDEEENGENEDDEGNDEAIGDYAQNETGVEDEEEVQSEYSEIEELSDVESEQEIDGGFADDDY